MPDMDKIARERIVGETASNFFVEAGAGSGKTTILVNRMVAMVESGIDVAKICAITFTKAAANEFYDRFQKKLVERANDFSTERRTQMGALPVPTEETRRRCAKAAQNIDLCFLGTIDAFCNTVLSEHPMRAGVPSNTTVCEDSQMRRLWKAEYSNILRGDYGQDLQKKAYAYRFAVRKPEETFLDAMTTLMALRSGDIERPALQPFFFEEKEGLLAVLRRLSDQPELLNTASIEARKAMQQLQNKLHLLEGAWLKNLPEVLQVFKDLQKLRVNKDVDISAINFRTELFIPHASRGKVGWYELDCKSEDYPLAALTKYQYAVSMDFFVSCMEPLAKKLRATGALTFNDNILYLRNLLREDAAQGGALIRHISQRHSFFLIDEFQDTNPLQGEIFFYLTAIQPQEHWDACVPRPGSLFIVGDPKQSIYRFREADVSAFLKVRSLFVGEMGEVLQLQRNFRSTRTMKAWFNLVFSHLLPEDTEVQSQFSPIPLGDSTDEDGTFGGVYSYSCTNGSRAALEEHDESKVAAIIQQLVNNPAYKVQEKGDAAPRPITYRDFMLITPTKSHLRDYIRAFSRQKIPFFVEGEVGFDGCPSLTALCKVLRAIAYPHDAMALYGALTGEVFRISKKRLYSLKSAGANLSLYADLREIDSEVAAILKRMQNFVFQAHNCSLSALFSKVYDELSIAQWVGAENLDYLYYALELVRAAEAAGKLASLQDGADYLETLMMGESGIERAFALKASTNCVHIANLHKVKGLEAPIVILAGRSRRGRAPEHRTARRDGHTASYIFKLDELSTAQYEEEMAAEEACLAAENTRLLYVAATRARRALIIGGERTSKGEISDSNIWNSLLSFTDTDFCDAITEKNPTQQPAVEEVDALSLLLQGAEENLLRDTAVLTPSFTIKRPSMIRLKGAISAEDDYEDLDAEEVRAATVRKDAALVGTMVHRLMEVLIASDNLVSLPQLCREIEQEYAPEGSYAALLTAVGQTVRNGGYVQETDVPQDILKELLSADEVHCELPFAYQKDGLLWNGVIDVLYRNGGSWHILDYKTTAEIAGLDEKYAEQLQAYIAAVQELLGVTADAKTYHIAV